MGVVAAEHEGCQYGARQWVQETGSAGTATTAPIAERLYIEYTDQEEDSAWMPKRIAQDWEELERSLHAAGVSPEEIDSGARALLAQARGHLPAEARKALTRSRGNYSRG
ncbi:MAG: hypothetical protein ACRDOK_29780 [Streptosporangiaceae bacterium]